MRLLAFFALVAIVASTPTFNETSAPPSNVTFAPPSVETSPSTTYEISTATPDETSEEVEKLVIDTDFFSNEYKFYTAEHEIIRLLFPANALNVKDDDNESNSSSNETSSDNEEKLFFFVEADLTNGIEYKGLSVYKNGNVTKILPTGTSAAAVYDNSNTAYFGATDGLYKYNANDNTAVKYGPITDNIIDIVKFNGIDMILILTDKNELFKVTEDGTKKEKVSEIYGAKQIILDFSNNLYFYDEDKEPYVINIRSAIKKIEGLPSETDITLINSPFVTDDAIPAILGNTSYILYANGISELTDLEFKVKPTAFSTGGTLIQYYAYNKSIYEYNVSDFIFKFGKKNNKTYLESNKDQIETISSRSMIKTQIF